MKGTTLENLGAAVLDMDPEMAAKLAAKALEAGVDPIEALEALTGAIRQVGDGFGKGELWLPELVGAASAMQSAMPIINEAIVETGATRQSLGTIVIGTVFGDVHTIGKTMVSTLCAAEGFEVHDLGVNVTPEEFVRGIERHEADILAMSALMTMTAPEMRKVIDTLEQKGIRGRVRIMVGGAGVNENFAQTIGADGYDPTAPGAAKLARHLVGNDRAQGGEHQSWL